MDFLTHQQVAFEIENPDQRHLHSPSRGWQSCKGAATRACDHTFDDYRLIGMVKRWMLDIKVRKGCEQTCKQLMHRLAPFADGTKWCNLVTWMMKGRNSSRDIMSFLGCDVFSHNRISALSEAES
jgi:hypothetical protein